MVDRQATFRSFGTTGTLRPAGDYLLWIREVAEACWASQDVSDLPWWETARNDEEIASLDRHPTATTFDGRSLIEDRAELELEEFVRQLVPASGHSLEDLSSRRRGRELTRGRIEFATLAVGRYGLRVCDVASLLSKHPNSVTKWLNRGLRLERDHPGFEIRFDQLDAAISQHP